jgi:hypothetical protein
MGGHERKTLKLSAADGQQMPGKEAHGDLETALRHRRAEAVAARRGHWRDRENAAQTNVLACLVNLGRYAEALPEADALIARLGDEDTANMAYALFMQTAALRRLHRNDEVRAAARRLWPRLKRYHIQQGACEWLPVLASESRHTDAARLSGFLVEAIERDGDGMDGASRKTFDEAETLGRAALGDAAWERAVLEGRALDDAGAYACLGA